MWLGLLCTVLRLVLHVQVLQLWPVTPVMHGCHITHLAQDTYAAGQQRLCWLTAALVAHASSRNGLPPLIHECTLGYDCEEKL